MKAWKICNVSSWYGSSGQGIVYMCFCFSTYGSSSSFMIPSACSSSVSMWKWIWKCLIKDLPADDQRQSYSWRYCESYSSNSYADYADIYRQKYETNTFYPQTERDNTDKVTVIKIKGTNSYELRGIPILKHSNRHLHVLHFLVKEAVWFSYTQTHFLPHNRSSRNAGLFCVPNFCSNPTYG